MKHLDLFSGIGGFALAAQRTWREEHEPIGFCEIDKHCRKVLARHWPDTKIFSDVRELVKNGGKDFDSVELISGGDPCQSRSKARGSRKSRHPDLSGYFLSLVGQLRPQWVVRENVPAPDDVSFATALEILGYRTLIIRIDAAAFTAQQRIRDFIVGSTLPSWEGEFFKSHFKEGNKRYSKTLLGTRRVVACLTTHPRRGNSSDNYIFDGRILRFLDSQERIRLSGFPFGWLEGFSSNSIARMTGNAVVPQVATVIFQVIKEVEI